MHWPHCGCVGGFSVEPGEPKDEGVYCHLCADSFELEGHINLTEAKFYDCDEFILEPPEDDHALADRGRPQFKEIKRRLRLRNKTTPRRRLRRKSSDTLPQRMERLNLEDATARGIPPPPKV